MDSPSINNLRLFNSHSHKPSTSSSLRNPLPSTAPDQDQNDPFLTPNSSQTLNRPKLSPLSTNSSSFTGMRQLSPIGGGGGGGQEESVLSPDQALASYSVARALSPQPPIQTQAVGSGLGGGRMGSMKNLLKRFKSSQSLRNDVREKENEEKEEGGGERAKRGPFGDEFGQEEGGQGHVIPELIRRDFQGGGFEGLGSMGWNDGEKGEEEEMKEKEEKEEKGWNGGNAY